MCSFIACSFDTLAIVLIKLSLLNFVCQHFKIMHFFIAYLNKNYSIAFEHFSCYFRRFLQRSTKCYE